MSLAWKNAIGLGELRKVRQLLKTTPNPNGVNIAMDARYGGHYYQKPIVFATQLAANSAFDQSAEIVKVMLEHGVNPNVFSDSYHGDKITPLMEAALNDSVEMVKLLLKHGADVLMSNDEGLSAFDATENDEILDLLEGAKEKCELRQKELFQAIQAGDLIKLKSLLEQNANLLAKNADGKSTIAVAKEKGNEEIIRILYDAGAEESTSGCATTGIFIVTFVFLFGLTWM